MAEKKEIKINGKKVGIIAGIVVAAIVVVLFISGGIYCVSTHQSPSQAASTLFNNNEEKIIGKWQNKLKPGSSAFVFYKDGTYDNYILTVNFSGEYKIEYGKLYLTNPKTKKDIVYNMSVSDDELILETYEEDGKKSETNDVLEFEKVDELKLQSLNDLIGELQDEFADKNEDKH